jgi:hypothetical protein
MNQIELNQDTRDLLDRVRHKRKCLTLYDMPADLAEAAVWEIGKILLDPQKLPTVQYNTYRWYLRELSKLLRTPAGWDLALELELCLRKWVGFCLDPAMLQALLRECYDRIGAMTAEEVEVKAEVEAKAEHGVANQGEIPPLGENASVGMTRTTKGGPHG